MNFSFLLFSSFHLLLKHGSMSRKELLLADAFLQAMTFFYLFTCAPMMLNRTEHEGVRKIDTWVVPIDAPIRFIFRFLIWLMPSDVHTIFSCLVLPTLLQRRHNPKYHFTGASKIILLPTLRFDSVLHSFCCPAMLGMSDQPNDILSPRSFFFFCSMKKNRSFHVSGYLNTFFLYRICYTFPKPGVLAWACCHAWQ